MCFPDEKIKTRYGIIFFPSQENKTHFEEKLFSIRIFFPFQEILSQNFPGFPIFSPVGKYFTGKNVVWENKGRWWEIMGNFEKFREIFSHLGILFPKKILIFYCADDSFGQGEQLLGARIVIWSPYNLQNFFLNCRSVMRPYFTMRIWVILLLCTIEDCCIWNGGIERIALVNQTKQFSYMNQIQYQNRQMECIDQNGTMPKQTNAGSWEQCPHARAMPPCQSYTHVKAYQCQN